MPQILLAHQDVFLVTRSIVFAEIKKRRRTADLFGDELQLTPDSILGEGALQATAAELA